MKLEVINFAHLRACEKLIYHSLFANEDHNTMNVLSTFLAKINLFINSKHTAIAIYIPIIESIRNLTEITKTFHIQI